MGELLSVDDVADRLGVTEQTVRKLIRSGDLVAINIGTGAKRGVWRLHPEDVEAFLVARLTTPGGAS